MKSDDAIREATAATLEFERDLESLVLAAFADGARIEGTWTIDVPVATAPNWTVEFRKERGELDHGDADDSGANDSDADHDGIDHDGANRSETDGGETNRGETDGGQTDTGQTDGGEVADGETDATYVPEFIEK